MRIGSEDPRIGCRSGSPGITLRSTGSRRRGTAKVDYGTTLTSGGLKRIDHTPLIVEWLNSSITGHCCSLDQSDGFDSFQIRQFVLHLSTKTRQCWYWRTVFALRLCLTRASVIKRIEKSFNVF